MMDSARHVISCHLTQGKRVQNALADVAGTIHQPLPEEHRHGEPRDAKDERLNQRVGLEAGTFT